MSRFLVAFLCFMLVAVRPWAAAPDEGIDHARSAVRQLVALDSAIALGVTSAEYSRRVVDAQLAISTELDGWSQSVKPEVRRAVEEGLRIHFLAARLFSLPPKERMMDPPGWLSGSCPLWDKSWTNIPLNGADLQVLWRCTRIQLDQAIEFLSR
jgi:hypothetical protein